jgi:hypothetical protein
MQVLGGKVDRNDDNLNARNEACCGMLAGSGHRRAHVDSAGMNACWMLELADTIEYGRSRMGEATRLVKQVER